jgi:hypothetical protein
MLRTSTPCCWCFRRWIRQAAAPRCGTFIVEELVDKADGENQVFESPDRGLGMNVPAITRRGWAPPV